MVLALHELATDAARVLVAHLVDLDGVITTVEGDDELTVLIVGLRGDQLGLEAQDVHILLEHLLHVLARCLWLQRDHRAHRVLISTEAVMRRNGLVLDGLSGGGQLDGDLLDAAVLGVPLLSELITVEDLTVTAVDDDAAATSDVLRKVVLLFAEGHTWAVGQDWCLGELLALQELREGLAAAVLRVDFLDLDRVVAEEVVEIVELVAAIVAVVWPQDAEREDSSIVVQEALQATIWSSTLQLDLVVVLEFGLIRRRLLHVDHAARLLKWIVRVGLNRAHVDTLIGVEALCELVAVDDSEDTAVHLKVHAQLQVRPVVIARTILLQELSSLEENALRDAGVGDTRLDDVESVIVQVEVDDALPNAEVLRWVLNDGLKEVGLVV